MLTYSFSTREKIMLVGLSLMLVAAAWYQLIFVGTQDQISELDNQINAAQDEILLSTAKIQQLKNMRAAVDQYKADGVQPSSKPVYDNIGPLTAELDGILASVSKYSLTFDDVDTSDGSVAKRGVTLNYEMASYEAARDIVLSLVNGTYPCSIDQLTISDGTASNARSSRSVASGGSSSQGNITVSVHLTFYEEIVSPVLSSSADEDSSAVSTVRSTANALGVVSTPSGAGTRVMTDGTISGS